METYRKPIESHFLPCEKTGSSIQEEVETSIYDTGAEFGCEDVAYDEDEGEINTYYLPGTYESRRSLKSVQKKHKNRIKAYTQRAIEIGTDLPYAHYSTGAHPSVLSRSRYANLNVGTVPTRRLCTASRHPKVDQIFLHDVKVVEQLIDLVLYILTALSTYRQEDHAFRLTSAIYSMARTPYARICPTSTLKGCGHAVQDEPSSSTQSAIDHSMLSGSTPGGIKHRNLAVDNKIGFVGPIR
ncbi:hypothetical protein KIW84_013019 [Lathyrus oleraceus]|uniref:Nodulin homeobox N-terminal domain-containing protein n=1 Tax=Pisum sativum TaxID=3888 RepID=A0A9D5BJB1_PEA|nr:hypothetical protein KIW84_013019 [Pisum sativum]